MVDAKTDSLQQKSTAASKLAMVAGRRIVRYLDSTLEMKHKA
jgi:hypothetical protein